MTQNIPIKLRQVTREDLDRITAEYEAQSALLAELRPRLLEALHNAPESQIAVGNDVLGALEIEPRPSQPPPAPPLGPRC
jgi:hypothetical protein